MATSRRRSPDSDPDRPPRLTVPAEQLSTEIDARIDRGIELRAGLGGDESALQARRQDYYTWGEYNETLLRRSFDQPGPASDYSRTGPLFFSSNETLQDRWRDLDDDIQDRTRRLQSLRERLPLFDVAPRAAADAGGAQGRGVATPGGRAARGEDVFVVHGHDGATKTTVARFLSQLTRREPVILHEHPDGGRTVIEKFEDHADQAAAAVVLLTGDDVGGTRTGGGATGTGDSGPSPQQPRARQNVVLELGFFIGRLGRANVVILYEPGVELPSDLAGVLYVALDADGAWRNLVARELQDAGIKIDLSALLRA